MSSPRYSVPKRFNFTHSAWADHADAISLQYSGTGALKTDFTRTGKRSKIGVVQDVCNSIMRYFKNHYMDGFRQDAFDLFLGVYRVPESTESPFADATITNRVVLVLL